ALLFLDRGVDLEDIAGWFAAGYEIVDADDRALFELNLALIDERGVLDLALRIAALDRGHRATEVVDFAQVLEGLFLQFLAQRLEVVGAAQRIDRVGDAGFVGDHLLRAEREQRRRFARQRQRFVARIGMQRL